MIKHPTIARLAVVLVVPLIVLLTYQQTLLSKSLLTDDDLARSLAKSKTIINSSRVLCWVLTGPTTITTKGLAILATWGPSCDKLLFMTNENDTSTIKGKVALPGVGEGYRELVKKSKEAWKYVRQHYADRYDWFYKCDDDTYTVVENLKYMLSFLDPAKPSLLGTRIRLPNLDKSFWYVSGGAGYILSREALHRVSRQIDAGCMNDSKMPHEDALVSRCSQKANVTFVSSLDQYGESRILPLTPDLHLTEGAIAKSRYRWVKDRIVGNFQKIEGKHCCSDLAISFHYIQPAQQHAIHYLVHKLHVFGTRIDDFNRRPHN